MGFAQQTQAYAQRLQQLADVALIINSMHPLEDILNLVTVHARQIIGTHQAITSLALGQEGARVMNAISLSDKYAAWRGYHEFPDRSNLYASVCNTNSPVRMTQAELEAHPGWSSLEKEIGKCLPLRGWLAAPLIGLHGRNLGLIQLSDKYEGEFTLEDQSILVQLAQMTSVAIENTQLYKQAQDAIRARDEMFSMVTHDLKNPLSAIKGYVQLLQKSLARTALPESERVAMILPRIDATATKMTAQINELLDLAQLQLGQPLELVRSSVDLVALIQQIVKEQQSTTQHHIRMETSVKKLIGQFDAARLERVIANLLSNAVKYSAKGSTIEVQVMQQNEQGHAYAVIVVRDQGIGIPASDLPYIFEPFRRAENVAGKIKGTGIGLSSAYQIVKQHGGTITVESQEGKGSLFTVQLPLTM
jgi:signal transduction histidine kinase